MSNDVQEQELGAEVVTSASASVDDGQESLRCKFENLCRDLNMDRITEERAFEKFNEVRQNYSLDEVRNAYKYITHTHTIVWVNIHM